MTIEQFKFKESLISGVDKEATLKTDKTSHVKLLLIRGRVKLQKMIKGKVIYNVTFMSIESKSFLHALKNISKRK